MDEASARQRDQLTGLLSRAAALRQIDTWQEEARVRGVDTPIHAILLGFKRFSSVNLAYGAAAGDRTLISVAKRIAGLFGPEFGPLRLISRIGGGSFLLAAAGPCTCERWQWLAEELSSLIAQPIVDPFADADGGMVRVRPHMALLRSRPDEPPERMLERMAETLDQAKEQRGERLLWVDSRLAPPARRGRQLEADLLRALDRGEIAILFQPQFACASGALVGAEALARWRHPQLGELGAEALFAIAERADHVAQLSRYIAGQTLASAAAWPVQKPAPLRLSLNITAGDLATPDFVEVLTAAVARSGFAPRRLTLEITEEALLGDLDRSALKLRQLAESGTAIALDDFGAGFSNFRYLKYLPLDGLKLDRGMVEGIAEEPRDLAVLRGILAMARALGLSVTAEGVESEAQRAVIAREGCDTWQGFLGSPPLAIQAFTALAAATLPGPSA